MMRLSEMLKVGQSMTSYTIERIAALEAENAALKADAERWRRVRNGEAGQWRVGRYDGVIIWVLGTEADAAVDSAKGEEEVGVLDKLRSFAESRESEKCPLPDGALSYRDCREIIDVVEQAQQKAFREAAAIRPPRSLGTPPGGVWSGEYSLGWNDAVAAYAAVIKTRGGATDDEMQKILNDADRRAEWWAKVFREE